MVDPDAPELSHRDFPAGDDQVIVVYDPMDTGNQVEPGDIMAGIAADAATRANEGWRIVSLDSMNLRHSALFLGRDGSGYESQVAVIVVYGRAVPAS
ncbi:MAG TPA: hypothetical protein VF484_06645 [Candidatus Limnocylindrales bacterium]